MEFIILLLIALAVCLDSFAVSVTVGSAAKKVRLGDAFKAASILAVIQGMMPMIGWLIGTRAKSLISDYDHWIGFVLLFLVGSRMIYEGFKKKKDRGEFDPFSLRVLLILAVASSIDALVVGVSFAFISTNIFIAASIIAFVTFLMVTAGVYFGKRLGEMFGKRAEIYGGIILIMIGLSFPLINWWLIS